MFTGLIDDVGTITAVREGEAGREFRIACRYEDLALGESIACQGACLTVRESGDGWFGVAAVVTTLDRTTVATWNVGRRLNLERAMRLGDRLGGHLVQGHVDAVGSVVAISRRDDALLVDIAVPPEIAQLLVPHGSICVDGASLTVNALPAARILQVSIIDFTLRQTTLGELTVHDRVHLEGDVIGKYVRSLVAPYRAGDPSS
jgi:riboflavin synthase